MHDFNDFPSEIFYDIWTQQRQSEQNFKNFTFKGRFSKEAKIAQKFPGLATSGRHNSATTKNAKNSRLNGIPTRPTGLGDVYSSIFTVRIYSKSFPWAVRCVQAVHPPNIFASSITYLWYQL